MQTQICLMKLLNIAKLHAYDVRTSTEDYRVEETFTLHNSTIILYQREQKSKQILKLLSEYVHDANIRKLKRFVPQLEQLEDKSIGEMFDLFNL